MLIESDGLEFVKESHRILAPNFQNHMEISKISTYKIRHGLPTRLTFFLPPPPPQVMHQKANKVARSSWTRE